MANLIITQVPLGLKIVTDSSTLVLNEFSIKKSNNSVDKLEIISDVKGNYAAFEVDFSIYAAVSFNGNVCVDLDALIAYLEGVPAYISSIGYDEASGSYLTVDYAHHEIHEGESFYVIYSVASLGGMTSPDDMITLTFKTGNTTVWPHFTFQAFGTAGMRVRLMEAYTGGAESPTGQLSILNHNRNSSNTSLVTNGTTANQVNYDATLATGGITLWDQYLEGAGGPLAGGSSSSTRNELVLKQNTVYQLSLYGTATDPASLVMDWYEHENL